MSLVAVYGTLKEGFGNHRLLEDSKKVGDTILKGFDMYNLGYFPGIVPGEGKIHVEVYEVDAPTLDSLDRLEGYRASDPKGGLYDREIVDTPYGEAYIYTYNGAVVGYHEKVKYQYEGTVFEAASW